MNFYSLNTSCSLITCSRKPFLILKSGFVYLSFYSYTTLHLLCTEHVLCSGCFLILSSFHLQAWQSLSILSISSPALQYLCHRRCSANTGWMMMDSRTTGWCQHFMVISKFPFATARQHSYAWSWNEWIEDHSYSLSSAYSLDCLNANHNGDGWPLTGHVHMWSS